HDRKPSHAEPDLPGHPDTLAVGPAVVHLGQHRGDGFLLDAPAWRVDPSDAAHGSGGVGPCAAVAPHGCEDGLEEAVYDVAREDRSGASPTPGLQLVKRGIELVVAGDEVEPALADQ